MTRRAQPEAAIQRTLCAHLHARGAKGMFWFAIGNGGWRSKVEAKIMKGTGTKPGTPDLAFVYQGRAYFLEVKTETGKASEHQLAAIAALNEAGAYATIAHGLDAALKALELWGLLVGKSS